MIDTDDGTESPTFRVLHVDDDRDIRELVVACFAQESPELDVVSVESAEEAMEHLSSVDCIISDYDMPGTDGLEFLRAVRAVDEDLPFVLYTAAGNEEIASEAISAGVTDYLQKHTDGDHYSLLANRVRNYASRYRTSREMDRQQQRFRRLVEQSSDVVSIVDPNGVFTYVSPASKHVFGYEPEELIGENGFTYLHPDDVTHAVETLAAAIDDPEARPVISFRFAHPEKGWVHLENRGRYLVDDPLFEGFIINSTDVTERVKRAMEVERQRDRLAEFASVVSHDLRNPLSVAGGNLSLLEETGDLSHTTHVRIALERMERIIDDLLTLAREGEEVEEFLPTSLARAAETAWRAIDTDDARLSVETDATILADPGRLVKLLESLFANAVTHAGPGAHIRVTDVVVSADTDATGSAETSTRVGFAVSDDGPGIPREERTRIFDYGISSMQDHTGFGLTIVRRVADAHNWSVTVTDSDAGGARFEFRGVQHLDDPVLSEQPPDDDRVPSA